MDQATIDSEGWRLAVALGVGLLLGLERERRKRGGPSRAPAGIRTFALVALLGGLAMALGSAAVVAVALGSVGVVVVAAYLLGNRDDPGLTTEVALLVAFLLGALAQQDPRLAAGAGVAVAILLAARDAIHRIVAEALTEQELHDGLLLGAAALVILPLAPDKGFGPYGSFNPFTVWRLVVIVMAVSAGGYAMLRMFGPRYGLPLAGLISGFVSSSATIASMGSRARQQPELLRGASAAAILSTVATVLQMVAVVGAVDPASLRELAPTMAVAGVVALGYGAFFALRALHEGPDGAINHGRAFEPKSALVFAATVAAILVMSAVLNERLGEAGLILSTAAAGFADTHSAAIAVASLAASGKLEPAEAVAPILAGFTTNSLTKVVVAYTTGGRRFALNVVPGVALVLAGAWTGWLAGG